jgi:hypothetical protein
MNQEEKEAIMLEHAVNGKFGNGEITLPVSKKGSDLFRKKMQGEHKCQKKNISTT